MARKIKKSTVDSFTNFTARLGLNQANQLSGGTYSRDYLTRNRTVLEAAYRTSWVVGQAVDCPADDMTRAGIEITSSMTPDEIEQLQEALLDFSIWQSIASCVRWARLFGGSLAYIMIDGQDPSTKLNPDSIGEGSFKGLMVLDRWMVNPSLNNLVKELGPSLGKPKFYDTISGQGIPAMKIHHSRVLRFEGLELPFYEKSTENGWGESIIERIHDRLITFDSTTMGAAQLAFKAHLRTLSVENLREIISSGGASLEGLLKQIEMIRQYQSNEGMTLLDATDKFEAHSYTFTGMAEMIIQMAQQLCGGLDIPMVRFFGQSPAGLNSTGESDLRTYYDGINKKQNNQLRRPLSIILDIMYRSLFGTEPPKRLSFKFNPLWLMTDTEKAELAAKNTETVLKGWDSGLVSEQVTLKELRQQSSTTGVWTNITDEDIEAADDKPPEPELDSQVDEDGNPIEPVDNDEDEA